MAKESFKRKLTAILSADVEGYSRLMGEDEEATVRTITTYREVFNGLYRHYFVLELPYGSSILQKFEKIFHYMFLFLCEPRP